MVFVITVLVLTLFCSFENSVTEETYKLIKKLEYFHVQHTLFAMKDKRKYIKNRYTGRRRKASNKPTKPFPNKWRKLAKSNKGFYYNQGKWINEHKYGKRRYYNEYYYDDFDLVTTDESYCNCKSEAESE